MKQKNQANEEQYKIKDNYSERAVSNSPSKFLSEFLGEKDINIRRIEMIDSLKNEQR